MQIRETPNKRDHKIIEFYDVRAADAALKALNKGDVAGKRIKHELRCYINLSTYMLLPSAYITVSLCYHLGNFFYQRN